MLSKLVTLLISPLGTALLLGCLGLLALFVRRLRLAAVASGLAVVWLWCWSTPAASHWLRFRIEQQHPPPAIASLPAAPAMVVLGGAVTPPTRHRPEADMGSAVDRLWYAARLYRAGKAPLIILSGGYDPEVGTTAEAAAMRSILVELGVPAAAMVLEDGSRNTRENAAFSAELLRARGINQVLLVTSALHMERARRQFAALGLSVVPAPTDFEAEPSGTGVLRYLPDSGALDGSTRAFKELLGQLVLR